MDRKLLLAEIRTKDYTHAGEQEAIDITMNKFPKNTNRKLLDIGCGLGGTANYINIKKWGNIKAIDIKKDLIDYAKTTYPNIEFYHCNAINCSNLFLKETFDVIYHFNSFYAIINQEKALNEYYKIATNETKLLIFDYMVKKINNYKPPFQNDYEAFTPINYNIISKQLLNSGWNLEEFIDISENYIKWYKKLLSKIHTKKMDLIKKFGEKIYNQVLCNFTNLYNLLINNNLGGCIVYASKVSKTTK